MSSSFHLFEFDSDVMQEAEARAQQMGVLPKNQYGLLSVVTGFVGEIVLLRALQQDADEFGKAVLEDTLNYDIAIHPNPQQFKCTGSQDSHNQETVKNSKKIRIEVKSRRTKVEPLAHYMNCVSAHNSTQQCDLYAFLRVKYARNDPETKRGTVYFCGAMTQQRFAHLKKYSASTKSAKLDCFYVYIRDCCSYKSLLQAAETFCKDAANDAAKEEVHTQPAPTASAH
jgi:hypothetical protein